MKKRTRCRNAALMEFVGKQPHYCAEHIESEPDGRYCKCKAPYHTTPDDNKVSKPLFADVVEIIFYLEFLIIIIH